jgi:hypothetical protein
MVKKMPDEVGRALYQEAQIERTESMERTPVKEGVLKGSHEVQDPVIKGSDISVTIAVGGPSAPYAIIVHEDLEVWHEVGQAKFLESTINESKPWMARRVGKRIQLNRMLR